MKILFTHSLNEELIDLGYLLYIAYFDGDDRTILYPFKFPVAEAKLAQLQLHQPLMTWWWIYMAEEAANKKIFISNKYFPVLKRMKPPKTGYLVCFSKWHTPFATPSPKSLTGFWII